MYVDYTSLSPLVEYLSIKVVFWAISWHMIIESILITNWSKVFNGFALSYLLQAVIKSAIANSLVIEMHV